MKTLKITLFLLGITFMGFAQKDEAAIKAVIEKETQSFVDRNAEAMLSCLANTNYDLQLVAENGNVHYRTTNSKASLEKDVNELMQALGKPTGETFKNVNYVIRVNGTSAFAYYDEITKDANGKESNFHEVRYLEKMAGNWKIVYVGAVSFMPEKK